MTSKLSKEDLFEYSEKLKIRLEREDWILYAASFGSICRGKLKSSSDLDVSIVKKPGLINGLKGLWFILKEKKIADFYKIPLELYLNDIPENSIKRFASEKNPVILFDKYNVVDKYYDEKLDLAEARKLNGLQ
jgi:predicted nucleotidyltransferase